MSSSRDDHDHDSDHDPRLKLTDTERELLPAEDLLRAYLGELTDPVVLVALKAMPERTLRRLLTPMKLPSLSPHKVGSAVASRVRGWLMTTRVDRPFGCALLTAPFGMVVSSAACWPLEDLLTLMSGSDEELVELADRSGDVGALLAVSGGVDELRRVGVAAYYGADRAGSAVMAGWLLAEDHVPPQVVEQLGLVWGSLRDRLPELPERPRPLAEAAAVVNGELVRRDAEHEQPDGPASATATTDGPMLYEGATAPEPEPDDASAHVTGPVEASAGEGQSQVGEQELGADGSDVDLELAQVALDRVRKLLAQARSGCDRVSAALTAERAPGRQDVRDLTVLADSFDDLARTLAADGAVPVSVPEMEERLAVLLAAAGSAGQRGQVARLVELMAPEYLAAAAEAVRELARRVIAEDDTVSAAVVEGLLALVSVIDLVAQCAGEPSPDAWQQITSSQQVALTNLPQAAGSLVLSAGRPVLNIPDVAVATDAPSPAIDATAPEPAGDPASDSDVDAELHSFLEEAAQQSAAGEQHEPSGSGAADDEPDDRGPGGGSSGDDSPTPAPAGRADTAPGDPDDLSGLDDLAELDELLAAELVPDGEQSTSHRTSGEETAAEPAPPAQPAAEQTSSPAMTATGAAPAAEPVQPEPAAPEAPEAPAAAEKAAPAKATAPAPAPDVVDPVHDDAQAPIEPETIDATHATLLREGQFGLAGWLVQANGGNAAQVATRFMTSYASAMRSSTGECALAFADQLRHLTLEDLDGDMAGTLLAFSAAIRAGLLSPAAGAAGVLREVAPAVSHSQALAALAESVLAAFWRGAHLTPGTSSTVAGFAELETERARLIDVARDTLETGPSRTIRYQVATEVWTTWIAQDGKLGSALALVAAGLDDRDSITSVRDVVLKLRTKSGLDKALDDESRHHGSLGTQKKIIGPARGRIMAMVTAVIDTLAEWVVLSERIETMRSRDGGGWQAGPLAELRSHVAALRDDALAELEEFAVTSDEVTAAAAGAAAELLRGSFGLLDGQPLPGEEIDPVRAVNRSLLLAADLRMTADLLPEPAVTVPVVLDAAFRVGRGDAGWQQAFDLRGARGDHIGTLAIIELVRPGNPTLAGTLTVFRDTQVQAATDRLTGWVDALSSRIDSDRRYGRISTDQWSDFSSRASSIRAAGRRDFDVLFDQAAALEADRAAAVAVAVQQERERLEQRLADDPTLAGAAEQIRERIDAADLTTAAEYLELASRGQDLPTAQSRTDHLVRFFPAFPAAFAAGAAPGRSRDAKRLVSLQHALDTGTVSGDTALAEVLAGAGLDITTMEPRRRQAASSGLDRWLQLGMQKRLNGQFTLLKGVLALLGFEADNDVTPTQLRTPQHGRAWARLSGVRATGKALVPAFGSAMSPTGSTLRVLACWASPSPQQLADLLRDESNDESVLVLYFGTMDPATRRALTEACRRRRQPVMIVVDDATVAYLACQDEPSRETTMTVTLPFTAVNPFTPDVAGLLPMELMYGRSEELSRVTSMMGSCLITGGRQLGKSVLLRAAEREFDDGAGRRAVYLSIYPVGRASDVDAVWTTLWPKLAEKAIVPQKIPTKGDVGAQLIDHVRKWTDTAGNQLLLLLDEADRFLDADSSDGKFTHVARFRDLMEVTERRVKVVFAGLHQTARFERLGNHPLAHFGGPVVVGPLDPQPAYDLLTRPLDALGFRFAADAVAARVLALANNQPALIQLFGAALLNRLHKAPLPAGAPPQRVTPEDVDAVWRDETLRAAFRSRFDWTLALDPRYKVIAFVVAGTAHTDGVDRTLSPAELRRLCEERWPLGFANDLRTDEFRALLNECVALGVLSYAGGGYRLRTPNVRELLGSREEVEEVLASASTFDLPESFDGSQYRSPFGEGDTRSPLTEAQLSDVLAARNQVLLVAGTSAITVDRVPAALEQANKRAATGRSVPLKRLVAKSGKIVNDAAKVSQQAADGHGVVVSELRGSTQDRAEAELVTARELIASHAHGTLGIALVAGPELASVWLTVAKSADASSGLTELHRFDAVGLRLWLSETTLPFQDDASRNELLKVTGGWPMLVNRVVERHLNRDSTDSHGGHAAESLAGLTAWLKTTDGATAFEQAAGVRALPALSAAWDVLLSFASTEGSDIETLAEFVADLSEDTLGSDGTSAAGEVALKEAGFASVADVVEVLRMMGALQPTGEATWTCEPVLAAASQVLLETDTSTDTPAGTPAESDGR